MAVNYLYKQMLCIKVSEANQEVKKRIALMNRRYVVFETVLMACCLYATPVATNKPLLQKRVLTLGNLILCLY